MNPIAAVIMVGIAVAWLGMLGLVIYLKYRFGLALFALVTIAAFVRWGRLG
jgi:hypothetical protein